MQKIRNDVNVEAVYIYTHTQVFRKLIKKYINIKRQVNL